MEYNRGIPSRPAKLAGDLSRAKKTPKLSSFVQCNASPPFGRDRPNGPKVANFSVGVTRRWNDKDSGEKREETTWYRVAAYGYLADNAAAILKKGSQVLVDGRVSARAYLDNNQLPAVSLDLNADTFQILGNKGSGADSDEAETERPATVSGFDHDIPF